MKERGVKERIYTDEEIPLEGTGGPAWAHRSAAESASLLLSPGAGIEIPPRVLEMIEFERSLRRRGLPEERVFRETARAFADLELEEKHSAWFSAYFPTYTLMSLPQRLAYLSWRTRWRRGERAPAPVSFAFVHLYELINGAPDPGADPSPAGLYRAVESFWEDYRRIDLTLDRYAPQWLDDFVVYHGLPREWIRPGTSPGDPAGVRRVAAVAADLAAGVELAQDPGRLEAAFAALSQRSGHHLEKSAFWPGHEEKLKRLAVEVFERLARSEGTSADLWLGARLARTSRLFRSAVFDFTAEPEDRDYVLSPTRRWLCRKGAWRLEEFFPARGVEPAVTLLMRVVEKRLREAEGWRRPIKAEDLEGRIDPVVTAVLADWAWAERAAANPARRVDFSKLSGIRADAAETQEKLIVENAAEDVPEVVAKASREAVAEAAPSEPPAASCGNAAPRLRAAEPDARGAHTVEMPAADSVTAPAELGSSAAPQPPAAPAGAPEGGADLSPEERAFLLDLLAGRFDRTQTPGGLAPEMAVDRLNEKLFDAFGDAVLEWDGAKAAVIEDYAEDLRDLLA